MNRTCSRCGGTTEFRLEHGATVIVCLECGLIRRGSGPVASPRAGPESLGVLLAGDLRGPVWRGDPGSRDDDFEADEVTRVDDATAELLLRDAPFGQERPVSGGPMWLGPTLVAAGSVTLAAGFALMAVAGVLAANTPEPEGPTLAAATPLQGASAVTPAPAPLPVPVPVPEPAPDIPEALPSEPTTAAGWVERGWSVVGRDPGNGAEAFRRAIRLDAADGEAAYGLGYALLSMDDVAGATPWLCQAAASVVDDDTRRDVAVLVKRHGLSCPGNGG